MGKNKARPPIYERDWLAPGEAAHMAGVSLDTISRWLEKGYLDGPLTARLPSGRWRIDKNAVKVAVGIVEARSE